ncbi:MAG: ChbG/HpnK family deacetylase [Bacteroidaceae bacterium]|nr:ChbG/HpnK family deacetylase [Bacteroidaceae bacterium]
MKRILFTLALSAGISSASAQKLIVRMDDIGATHSENVAVIKCYQEGIGRSAEIMPVCPWFLEGARMCNDNPGLDVGIHVAFSSEWSNYKWRPITHCPSLCDEDGYLKPFPQITNLEEAEAELRAQIELGMKYVKNVTHITDHMMWTFQPGMNDMVERVAKEYGLFYQGGKGDDRYGLNSLGIIMGQKDRESVLLDLLTKMEKGKTYWVIEHPALEGPELETVYTKDPSENVGADRQNVTDAFCSPKVMKYIKEHGIELISFKQAYDESQKK